MSAKTGGRWWRLAAMSWDELWTRGRQEVAKRCDAARYRLGIGFGSDGCDSLPEVPARFFFETSDLPRLRALLRHRLSREADKIVEQAESICRHRFDLLGHHNLDYGPEIDWHFDVVHGKRAPRKPWFQINFLDSAEVGDAKIIWELNRHQHLVTLAKAYCLTREQRFVIELLRQWYHWQQENPYPIGINWASSLEVAFRSISWLWVRHFLADCPMVPEYFQRDLGRALGLNGRHIERYLSTYFSPNTHLLGESVGLFFIGTLCPQLPAARRWQQRGWESVLCEAGRQVQPDGMHFEQSTYYHVYALDFFLHARQLAIRNQMSIPAWFDQTLEKMLEILRALGQAGAPPRLGDDDGGRVFNPQRNHAEHLLDPLATGAVLFARADFKAAVGGLREEMLWLLGPEGVTEFDRIPSIPPGRASTRFEPSGIYVMACSEPVAQQLVIDAGPQGANTAGHGHADALSIHLTINGREALIDPGTFGYVGVGADRDLFRGTAEHNTLRVDGCHQAEPVGPFAWQSQPSVQVEQWVAGKTFDLFAGSHTGYCRLPEAVVHRRWVFHLKSHFWLVRDLALGDGVHDLDLCWHVAPGRLHFDTATNAVVVLAEDKQGLALLPLKDHGWLQEVGQGWWSPVYGRKEPSPALHFRIHAALPVEFVTLLLPVREAFGELGLLVRIDDGGREAVVRGYKYVIPDGYHYFFFVEGGQRWELGPWASDAQFLYCGMTPEGIIRHLVLCEGSYIEISGQRVLACKRPVARTEWLSTGGTRQIFCSDELALDHLSEDMLLKPDGVLLGACDPCGEPS